MRGPAFSRRCRPEPSCGRAWEAMSDAQSTFERRCAGSEWRRRADCGNGTIDDRNATMGARCLTARGVVPFVEPCIANERRAFNGSPAHKGPVHVGRSLAMQRSVVSAKPAGRFPEGSPQATSFMPNRAYPGEELPVILPRIRDAEENQASAGSATLAVFPSSTRPCDGCRGTIPTIWKNAWDYGAARGRAASPIPARCPGGETRPGRPNARRIKPGSRSRGRSISPPPAPSWAEASNAIRRRHDYCAFRWAPLNRAIPEFLCGHPQPACGRSRRATRRISWKPNCSAIWRKV